MAVALIGLICIGLLGLSSIFYLTLQNRRAQEAAIVQPTVTVPPPTFTPTSTATGTPTDTPEPTPTATLVVQPGGQPAAQPGPGVTPAPGATPTNTLVVQPGGTPVPTPPVIATLPRSAIPEGGGVLPATGNYLAWLGLAVLVLLTLGAVNQFKRPRHPSEK